jgi:hypothetical protein
VDTTVNVGVEPHPHAELGRLLAKPTFEEFKHGKIESDWLENGSCQKNAIAIWPCALYYPEMVPPFQEIMLQMLRLAAFLVWPLTCEPIYP